MQSNTSLSMAVESILLSGILSDHYSNSQAQEIIAELRATQLEFCPNDTLYQIWLREKPYYEEHGMSAFDCGYCGKTLSKQ